MRSRIRDRSVRAQTAGLSPASVRVAPDDTDVSVGLKALFRAEYEPMYRLAFTMVSSEADAEEIVQTAFVGLARRWAQVDNPGGYLRVSVVNGARKCLRSAGRKRDAESSLVTLAANGRADDYEYLLDVIDSLPERQRSAIVMTYYAGMTSAEVGEALDCPAATARSLVHRALDRLRKEVAR